MMMRKLSFTIVTAGLLALPGSDALAQAQQPSPTPGTRPGTTTERDRGRMDGQESRPVWQNREGMVEARQLMGTRIRDAQGRDLGEIDQLLVDPQSGRVSHVVIGVGGFAGMGERKVVVPWSALQVTRDPRDRDQMVARVDQAALDQAPRYERRAGQDADRSPAASPPMGDRPATSPGTTPPATPRQ